MDKSKDDTWEHWELRSPNFSMTSQEFYGPNIIVIIIAKRGLIQAVRIYQFWHVLSWEYRYDAKKFVYRQLSRFICTRRIQIPLQNIHLVSFSDNDDVTCYLSAWAKTNLLCNFSIFLLNAFTERLDDCLYKWRCVENFLYYYQQCVKIRFLVVKGMHSDAFLFIPSFTIRLKGFLDNIPQLVKSVLDGSLY